MKAAGPAGTTPRYVLVIRRLLLTGLCVGACAVFSVGTIFNLYETLSNDNGMFPTLRRGDWVVGRVSPSTSAIFRGEVVEMGCGAAVRVVGLPGDRILVEGGTLIRNGVAVREPYCKRSRSAFADFPVPSALDADARKLWAREMPYDKRG